jgi:histidyl-tRNA synthetase
VVLVLDRNPEAIADYQKMTSDLRSAGIRAEMYLGKAGMNAQMKYADRRNSPVAVIVGTEERARRRVTVKDLRRGKVEAAGITDNASYKAARVGQGTVARSRLVSKVKAILKAQGLR